MTTGGKAGWILPVILALTLCASAAGAAGSTYLSGYPDLVATINGTNEFSPGSEHTVVIHVRNTGIDAEKIIQPGGGASGEAPSTARMVTLTLLPGDAPVEIRTDAQMVGDIPSGKEAFSPFTVWVRGDAKGGTYPLPLRLNYTYLASEDRVGSESVILSYKTEVETIDLPFTIRDEVILSVRDIVAEDLNAGGDGYVTLTLEHTGTLDGNNTIARIFQGDGSQIVPIDGRVFIGTFSPGDIVDARFKVRVAENAGAEEYPMEVAVEYQDPSGLARSSRPVTIGIPVIGETSFVVAGEPLWIYQGAKKTIQVAYENTGATKVYSAQARISAVDPFQPYDDTAYLGEIPPGGRAVAAFVIGVDKAATVKEYGLDTELRYRDSMGDTRITDPMTVSIEVRERTGILRILSDPIVMSILIAILIGCLYYRYFHRKSGKKQQGS